MNLHDNRSWPLPGSLQQGFPLLPLPTLLEPVQHRLRAYQISRADAIRVEFVDFAADLPLGPFLENAQADQGSNGCGNSRHLHTVVFDQALHVKASIPRQVVVHHEF